MPAPVLQVKRGALSNLPGLRAGEPAFTTDTFDFFVGIDSTTNNNKFLGSYRYWTKETSTTGSGVRFVERTDAGSNYIELKAPDTAIGSNVTYVLPATQGATSTVLTNDGNGNLSWGSGSSNATFSGITTFTDTTDSTTKDNGAVVIEGGLGIEKSVNIGGNLSVIGVSTFYGLVVGSNGINVSGFSTIYGLQILSNLGIGGNLNVDGVLQADNGATFTGIASFTNTKESTTYQDGAVVIDGGLGVGKNVNIHGNLDVDGNVTIGGTTTILRGEDVFIKNKDIVLGYTTSITGQEISDDDTANHAGVAIASTIGTPLVDFNVSGINTLPNTYKQMMWFKSGTLGFSTDTFAFNYGLAIGTTSMANGVRLAVGSGISMTDTAIYASNFYGSFSGNASSASSADQVKTISAADNNATYFVTFVDSNNGSATSETVYTDDGIYYNPGANTLTTQNLTLTGILQANGDVTLGDNSSDAVTVKGTATFEQPVVGTIGTATRATLVDTTGIANNQNYNLTFTNGAGVGSTIGVDAELLYNPNTNVLSVPQITIGTGVGVTQFSLVVGSGTSTSSVPTSSAIIDYVGSQIGNVDLTLGLNADTGGPSTVSTSQTLTINGTVNEVETSVSGQTITVGLPNSVTVTTSLTTPTVKATNVQANDGTTAITISNTTGAVGFANSVTINGDLYVLGTATEVNTSTLKVEDTLVDLGLINDNGSLVPPSSDLNLDIGILLNWYSGSAKKASVYWDDSAGRVGIASDVTESTGVLTANAYAAVEIGSLWVTDCAGTSQVISCTGSERFLNNITVDAGTF